MKTKFLFLTITLSTLVLNSCKTKEVADETISYEVILSNPNREAYIEYANQSGGNDIEIVNTANFKKTYTVKSNVAKQNYKMSVSCYAKYVEGSSTQFQAQTITVNILEDDKVVKTKTISGSSNLDIYSSEVTASLPTAIKYK